ncbi:hypothetical protein K525DRAFT_273664 [Schizophyllum commune Loenen D]|nr:hypothetical protein K525DRAFT_273664 [Schizophyllum commune Loenen D]
MDSPDTPPSRVQLGKRKAAPKGPLIDIPSSEDGESGSGGSLVSRAASSLKSSFDSLTGKKKETTEEEKTKARKRKSRRKRPRKETLDDLGYNPRLDPDLELSEARNAPDATPAGFFHRFKRLLKSAYARVAEVQPNDARCPVTLLSNAMRLLQLAHLAPSSIDEATAQRLACILGLDIDCFNPGTSSNLLYLFMELHLALDAGFCIFVPSEEVLEVMDHAISNHGLPPPDTEFAEESGIKKHGRLHRRNAAGYVNCDEVFKKNYPRPYDFLPLNNWPHHHCIWRLKSTKADARPASHHNHNTCENSSDEEADDGKPMSGDASDPNADQERPPPVEGQSAPHESQKDTGAEGRPGIDIYQWPFVCDGRPTLPKVLLHNNVYLVAWNAYCTLKKLPEDKLRNDSIEETAQNLFRGNQLDLLMSIGIKIEQLMMPSHFFRSPSPPNIGYDGLEEDVEWAEGDLELLEGMQDRNLVLESEAADSDEDQEHWDAEGRHTEGP